MAFGGSRCAPHSGARLIRRTTRWVATLVVFAAFAPFHGSATRSDPGKWPTATVTAYAMSPAGAAAPPPATVPGTIQAEDFDDGGSGVGFQDTTSGNAGGQ